MFKEIDVFKVRIHNLNKSSMAYIPNIISMGPIDKLFIATEWLASEALNDYDITNKTVEKRREDEGYSQKNLDDIKELGIRLGSRTQGYINQLCLMEDILIFEYKRMFEMLSEASGNKIFFNPEQDYKDLKDRFNSIRVFRNKVIAHTAYTYPREEDNPETIIRSILNLFPRDGGITLGNNFFSGFSPYRSQLPVISIFEWEEKIKPIFQDWKKLFIEKLEEVHKKCPLSHREFRIEVANPHLIQKIRKAELLKKEKEV